MTTVGYGDMSAHTSPERIFCVCLMVIGVVVFSYISGALASVISNYDEHSGELSEQVLYLNKISSSYDIKPVLYNEIKLHLSRNVFSS